MHNVTIRNPQRLYASQKFFRRQYVDTGRRGNLAFYITILICIQSITVFKRNLRIDY